MKAWANWAAAAIAAAGLLVGCTVGNVGPDYSLEGKSAGVLVVSLGRAGAAEFDMNTMIRSTSGGSSFMMVVDNNKVQKDFGKVVIPPPGSQMSDWGYVPTDAPLERVVVVAIAPGDYEIATVNGVAPRFSGSSPSAFSISSDRIGLKFSIKPGQVTYLGSVVFAFPDWLATSHASGPLRVVTTDTHDRDAKLVQERYPKLGGSLPASSLTESAPANLKYYLRVDGDGGSSKD